MNIIDDLTEGLIEGLLYEYRESKNHLTTWHPIYIRSVDWARVELIPVVPTGETFIIEGIPFGTRWNNSLYLSTWDSEKRLRRLKKADAL